MKIKLNCSNLTQDTFLNIIDFDSEMFKVSFRSYSTTFTFNIYTKFSKSENNKYSNSQIENMILLDKKLKYLDTAFDFAFYKKDNLNKYKFLHFWDATTRTMSLIYDLSKFY